jgi:hypothetical protein
MFTDARCLLTVNEMPPVDTEAGNMEVQMDKSVMQCVRK